MVFDAVEPDKREMMSRSLRNLTVSLVLLGLAGTSVALSQSESQNGIPIDKYVHESWDALRRSTNDCQSLNDPKIHGSPLLYLPAGMDTPPKILEMQRTCGVEVAHLPKKIRHLGDLSADKSVRPGLLYLPHPYVVPGGRFNEMYGWDSYFIILGLVQEGQIDLAKGIVENFFFEIEHYGAVLNANRTYFLTRSQPPLLTSMIAEVYSHTHDVHWLRVAYQSAESDYALWLSPEHRAGRTGLARYFDFGAGPVPEMADDSTYYSDVIRWLLAHPQQNDHFLVPGHRYPEKVEAERLRYTSCDVLVSSVCARAYAHGFRLSASFFRGDRAMRESGFDTSFRFGPFSGSTDEFAPVCLNSLLYKYERDMAAFAADIGRPAESKRWLYRAMIRKELMNRFLWNDKQGTFLDYNAVTRQASQYRYSSEFYPLWAGLASQNQAIRIRGQLRIFEQADGLAMSANSSGTQWDLPFGWAPAHWFAIEGLKRYGFLQESSRLASKFLHTVEKNYDGDGTIREKYNVADGTAEVQVTTGYKSNVVGFGWTNGVYSRLSADSSRSR